MNTFPFSVFIYELSILQLEGYDIPRFLRAVFPKVFFADTERQKQIKWTAKLILIASVSLIIMFTLMFFLSFGVFPYFILDIFTALLLTIALSPSYPLFLVLGVGLSKPIDWILKEKIKMDARRKLSEMKDLYIIGITGSYGKTTMKEILKSVLSISYKVIATQDSYNTDLSVSQEILNRLSGDTDIFIAEMGAHVRGDIARVCSIARPNISVLTGINEAHLERFGSIENTTATKFEITEACVPSGLVVLNGDDSRVVASYKKHTGNQQIHFFSSKNSNLSKYTAKDIVFDEDFGGVSFRLFREEKEIGLIQTPFMSEYIIGYVVAVFIVAGDLGMTDAEIQAGLKEIKPAEHRLSPHVTPNNMIVIDDSYNGNPAGVRSAIDTLERFTSRRKIFVTPGLVEMGDSAREVHREIGGRLGAVADIVILIENSTTKSITEGLEESGFNKDNLHIFKDKRDAYKKLGQISHSGDVILFQDLRRIIIKLMSEANII